MKDVEGPEVIDQETGQRYVLVQSNVRGRDFGGFVADVRREVGRRVPLPSGYYVTYGGRAEQGHLVPAIQWRGKTR